MTIEFQIDSRPISWNKYYAGLHWTKRSALSEEWKWLVKIALLQSKVPHTPLGRVSIEVSVEMKGKLIDVDNVCLKLICDGLVDWGTLPDDSPEYVESIKVSVSRGKVDIIKVRVVEI